MGRFRQLPATILAPLNSEHAKQEKAKYCQEFFFNADRLIHHCDWPRTIQTGIE